MGMPCGVASRSYEDDSAILRTKLHWVLVAALLVILVTIPLYTSLDLLNLFNTIGIWIVASYGLNLLTGYCGQISLGHAAFMGVGAYTSAILVSKVGMPFWITLPCAALMAGLAGIVFGLPSLRIKGFYLAMATLAAQLILSFAFIRWTGLTGGYAGMPAPSPELGGFTFESDQSYFYLILFVVVLATLAAKNIARSRAGRAFVAVRDNDLAAELMGINPFRYKLLAFFIASCFAGAAGALWAHYIGHVTAEQFTLWNSIWFLGIVIVGGLGSTTGTIFGVFFIKGLEYGTDYATTVVASAYPTFGGNIIASVSQIVFAMAIALFLIFEPRGLAHRWEMFKHYYRLWPFSY